MSDSPGPLNIEAMAAYLNTNHSYSIAKATSQTYKRSGSRDKKKSPRSMKVHDASSKGSNPQKMTDEMDFTEGSPVEGGQQATRLKHPITQATLTIPIQPRPPTTRRCWGGDSAVNQVHVSRIYMGGGYSASLPSSPRPQEDSSQYRDELSSNSAQSPKLRSAYANRAAFAEKRRHERKSRKAKNKFNIVEVGTIHIEYKVMLIRNHFECIDFTKKECIYRSIWIHICT